VRSLREVEKVDPGFKPEQVLSVQLSTVPTYQTDTQRIDYYSRVLEKVEAAGGVERAGIIGDLFIGGSPEQLISAEGAARVSDRFRLRRDEVSPGFFETLRIPIVKGRSISDDDGPTSLRVAVINAVMADRLWPGQDAVGRRFKLGAPESAGDWYTVVGVAGNMRRQGLENEPIAQMFEPLPQNPSRLSTLFVRTSTEPSALADTVRSAIRQVDKQTPIYGMTTLVDRLGTFQAERRFQTTLLTAFSVVALLLAVIGIYGVSQFSVATRTHEIGVRVAVGAQRGDIFRMIVGEGLQLSLIGLGVGLLGAWLWGRIGSSLLFGVTATDPMTYVLASCLLTFVAVLSCYLPARRAAGIDPLVALRHE
jgi:putative ABC transport system permease protein